MFIQIVKDFLFPIYFLIVEFFFILRLKEQLVNPDPSGDFKEAKYLATLIAMTWAIAGMTATAMFVMHGLGNKDWGVKIFSIFLCILFIAPAFIIPSLSSNNPLLFKSEILVFLLFLAYSTLYPTDVTSIGKELTPLLHPLASLLFLAFGSMLVMALTISLQEYLPNYALSRSMQISVGFEAFAHIWAGIITYGILFLLELACYFYYLSKKFM